MLPKPEPHPRSRVFPQIINNVRRRSHCSKFLRIEGTLGVGESGMPDRLRSAADSRGDGADAPDSLDWSKHSLVTLSAPSGLMGQLMPDGFDRKKS